MPDFALYRDKESVNYAFEAENFVQMARSFPDMRAFLHQEYELAATLGANGVHLTSQQFDAVPVAKALGLEVIISTHTHSEVLYAKELGADYVTYSPIFATPHKGAPKGVADLKELLLKTDMKIFALGGIVSQRELLLLEKSGVFGFASIRYFI